MSIPDIDSPYYRTSILELRSKKQLHTVVEDRLVSVMKEILPDYHPLKEPQGLAGGRNDLMLFEYSGKRVVFEIFASYSQVSRDLLILHKTRADIKIAIIIDKDVDSSVFDRYLRENPDQSFPFLFMAEIFNSTLFDCQLKLRQIVLSDQLSGLYRLLKLNIKSKNTIDWFKSQGVEVFTKLDLKNNQISYNKLFVTSILIKFINQGIQREKLVELGKWLSNNEMLRAIYLQISLGFNIVLYTDLVETFSFYSDIDLIDWIRAGYMFPQTFIIVSLNAVISEMEEKYLSSKRLLSKSQNVNNFVGSSKIYSNDDGRSVIVSLPNKVKSITLIAPDKSSPKELQDYKEMIQVIGFSQGSEEDGE